MIVERVKQPEYKIEFDYEEGIALAAALKFYAEKHTQAQHHDEWIQAAEQIEQVIYK